MPISLPISLVLAIAVAAGVAVGVFADAAVVDLSPWLIAAASLIAITLRSSACEPPRRLRSGDGRRRVLDRLRPIARSMPLREFLEERLGGFAVDRWETVRNETPTVIEGSR
jgi:hypothetical protein